MLNTDFDDFLDSDDDALFVEASNSLDDNLEFSETAETADKNISQNESLSSLSDPAHNLESNACLHEQKHVTSSYFESRSVTPLQVSNKDPNSIKSLSNPNSIALASFSAKLNTSSGPAFSKRASDPENSYVENRFTPGFTPKAKKRKLPGPAGLLDLFVESKETETDSSEKTLAVDIGFENIVSSQFTLEHLSLTSWQKLQTAVSSCSTLHSTAKYYSIKRVLQESSKKKLPKHMVVPVLCVLLKKISSKGSTSIFSFMDDTGEINGKIDADVISSYKDFIVEGTAFILKKVTFLCNMLLLKSENLVSVYHPDGLEKHPQTLDSVLETSEPLKPIKCECPKLSLHDVKNNIHSMNHDVTQHANSNHVFSNHKSRVSYNSNNLKKIPDHPRTLNKGKLDLDPKPNSITSNAVPSHVKNMRSDAFLENLLDEDNCMDEFDELLGNLDEESFMQEM